MNKFIIVLFILLCNLNVYAEDNKISELSQEFTISSHKGQYNKKNVKIICVDGYKYLVAYAKEDNPISVTQMFRQADQRKDNRNTYQPIKCGE